MSVIRDRLVPLADRIGAIGLLTSETALSMYACGADAALLAVEQRLHDEDMARIRAGKKPRHGELISWLRQEAQALMPEVAKP